MIAVSDTTPILSLLKADQLELLEILYGKVLIPEIVYKELTTNPVFKDEIDKVRKCPFLSVIEVKNKEAVQLLKRATGLDVGESEALVLYGEQKAELLLIDERKGRGVAKKMEIEHIGTMGILMQAFDSGILNAEDIQECLDKLLDKDIRLSKGLCNKVLNYIGLSNRY